MENNFNESMNLGNMATSGFAQANLNQQQPVAPVFGPTTTTGTNETITINTPAQEIPAQQVGQVQNMHSQVVSGLDTSGITIDTSNAQNVTVASAPVPPTPPTENTQEAPVGNIIRDEALVPVVILKNLVAQARKVGTYLPYQPVSQVTEISLGDFGIKVKASNGNIDYENIDDSIKYSISLTACVDIQKFGELLNNLDCPEIKLEYANSILKVVMPETGSEFNFAERVDLATQQVIKLDLSYAIPYDELTPIDLDKLVDAINEAKPVRNLPQVSEDFAGVYFGNLILASDRSVIYIQDNQPVIKTQQFFLGKTMCELITTMGFNANKFRIGFTPDSENNVRAITLSDGKLTICGNTSAISKDLNVEACERFWNMSLANSIVVNTKKFINGLKRTALFMTNRAQSDFNNFNIKGNTMDIEPDGAEAHDTIMVTNNTNFEGTIRLPMTKMEIILNTIKTDTFEILTEQDNKDFICIVVGGYKWVVSMAD